MTKTFEITANDIFMGEYRVLNAEAALDAYARDAGYDDFAALIENVPGSTREEVDVREIDLDKLCDAVSDAAGEPVFQDSYGNGVASVKGESYTTHREMAEAFGLDLSDFYG